MSGESSIVEKGLPCPQSGCGSSDAYVLYDDGHGFCFSCKTSVPSALSIDSSGTPINDSVVRHKAAYGGPFVTGSVRSLVKRGIREETARKYGYTVGEFKGKPVQVAPYYDDAGNLVAQKLRFPDKDFTVLGDGKAIAKLLFGRNLWKSGGKRVVVTEGEIDALSVAQAMGLSWPVVSIPNGASGAVKSISANIEWLETYEEVVLWFDNDEPGRDAAQKCAELLSPGKVKLVQIEAKDANELLKAGDSKGILNAVWEARTYRPDGIISGEEITVEQMKTATALGYSTPYKGLDEMTGGMRKGELILLTAGTGIGKSTIAREINAHFNTHHKLRTGNVFLEEGQAKTAQGYIAIDRNVPLGKLRKDPSILTPEQWEESRRRTIANGRTFFYSHFGSLEADNLLNRLRYMAVSLTCDFIVLDHLSIVVSGMESSKEGERKDIDRLVTRLRQLIEQTGVGVVAIAHLSKADGKSHEEGGRVTLNDLRGSASLKQLPDTIIALERDQQSEQPDEADVRVLKNREFGDTGIATRVKYNKTTGRLVEIDSVEAVGDTF